MPDDPFSAAAVVLARSALGADAVYTPPGSDPVEVRVVLSREEGDVLPGPAGLSAAGHAAMLPTALVHDRPPRGATLAVGGQTFRVETAELDVTGAAWRLTLRQ
ncbi:hypothetical protein GCM10010964_43580 [Caldovatus sediminis]|uniref:Uncharacterized protein n=1 Tax=Caldovatus sediminis TaxID=2041189 RepID=A0A8J3EE81_9PROT|nr:hypothetical protein [Caldovatus sediminis]GGG51685.1 hypothetical protein GCM10010964_43580 [Caldovatus sediminis]